MFERLRAAFDDRYVAFHSLKPTRHPRKRFPEIDFVVCGPEGLYAIEVKGGRVACRDGVWRYRDRNGGLSLSQESPLGPRDCGSTATTPGLSWNGYRTPSTPT